MEMPQLNKMTIAVRVAIACLLPLIGFSVFAGKDLLEKYASYSKIESIATVAEAAPTISAAVHELQKERGMSAGFINSKGNLFADALRGQRPLTDAALQKWQKQGADFARASTGTKFDRDIEAAQTRLADLSKTRSAVDQFALTAPQAAEFYTSSIANLISIIDSISDMSEEGRIIHQAIALASHVRRKEFAGQERATGAIGFGAGEFAPAVYLNLLRVKTIQDSQAATFRRNATPAQVDYVQNVIKGPVIDDLSRMREIAANAPFNPGAVKSIAGPQWFEVSSKYIDILKDLEDRLVSDFTSSVSNVVDEARWGFWGLMALFMSLLAITGCLAAFVALSITRPVARLVATMGELAQGHNETDVQGIERGDEIGQMARAVLVFRDAAIEKVRLESEAAEQRQAAEEERARNEAARAEATQQVAKVVRGLGTGLERLAHGDLTYRVTDEFAEEYEKVQEDFNAAIGQLQETIKNIALSSSEVSNAASEISTSTTDLSQRTEEQAASLEETSASMEEMAATVKKNAENSQHANALAQSTQSIAGRGGAVVAQAVTAMARIEESSRRISDIISVIDEIARQTNLLALNAAVEAARAGEAGRGFAVVASEVRSLAQRSSQAAKDIKDLITNSSGQVQEGVDLVNKAGVSLNEIVESIKSVAEIVADIAHASAEQAAGIDQINKALSQMDEVTQQNSALVEENAATAKTLEDQQLAMSEQVGFFRFGQAAGEVSEKAEVVQISRAPAAKSGAKPAIARRGRVNGGAATALAAKQEWQEF
jgi:methyl-accepting chemotaxis protein